MTETAIKAGGRLVTDEIRNLINDRVDLLRPDPARLMVREVLYALAVDLRAAGFQPIYVEQRIGEICNAFAAIEARA